jgi:hypothetical protein
MQASAVQIQPCYGPTSYAGPAPLPANGNWSGRLVFTERQILSNSKRRRTELFQ